MRRFFFVGSVFFLLNFVLTALATQARAFTITSDPQYIVMNFSEINELNWAAPEEEWQSTIKPKILNQLRQLKTALPPGTINRKLAWSTLQEYMNTPMDAPSTDSYYVKKIRRILEITEEENLPVFLPLNGFQWWDEMPELYNWWDPDGTHTPAIFFNRQRTKDFKQRFIAGYNPNNQWNVEWQNFTTPMKLNYRNWGGGGFRLAPPPNLVSPTYQTVQKGRLSAIVTELVTVLNRWQQEGKSELFAGITIGTEISLNASATPKDEFEPYGYRSMQDLLCPQNQPTCGTTTHWKQSDLERYREAVVQTYLNDFTRLASRMGIPKQRIYTHVWSESEPGDPRYTNYANAAFTLYSRPGMSFYGHAENPLSFSLWENALTKNGNPSWGAVEYSAGTSEESWKKGLTNTLDSQTPAKVLVIYNWTQHKDTGAIPALTTELKKIPIEPLCAIPEVLPMDPNGMVGSEIHWQLFPNQGTSGTIESLKLHMSPGLTPTKTSEQAIESVLGKTSATLSIPSGVYSWYLELSGCNGTRKTTSEPRTLVVPMLLPETPLPFWVEFILTHQR